MYRWRGRKWPPQPIEPIARHSGGRVRKRAAAAMSAIARTGPTMSE